LNKEIEQFIINNYKELRTFCISLTKHNDWAEDLLQDVLLQLYEKDNIKIEKLDNKSIKNYIFRCIITNWYSETSPFYRKVRRESSLLDRNILWECLLN
jgi:DNA-directed RNA polymerase specialized sigma24 family protein